MVLLLCGMRFAMSLMNDYRTLSLPEILIFMVMSVASSCVQVEVVAFREAKVMFE